MGIVGFDCKHLGGTCVSPYTGKSYALTFIDDFDGNALNDAYWTFDRRNAQAGEVQANQPQNTVVAGSRAVITARKERGVLQIDGSLEERPADYTSGKFHSKGKVEFTYGRVEMYAKAPYSQGVWPVFWTMGAGRGWPWGGELDVFEMVGGDDQWGNKNRDGQYLTSLHWCDPDLSEEDAWRTGKGVGHSTFGVYNLPNRAEGGKLADAWHVYGVEWTREKMISYIDGEAFAEADITDPTMREAFHRPHYMMINLGLGGSWAGDVIDRMLPQTFEIDWIKIWQQQ